MFFDHAKIHVAAGNGGNGCVSFRREKHVPRGGPDGGDGGRGGDVILVADLQKRDLQAFRYKVHFKAGAGRPGQGARKHGANGETIRVPVPLEHRFGRLMNPATRARVAWGSLGSPQNSRLETSATPRAD